jgi:hypothetical protein
VRIRPVSVWKPSRIPGADAAFPDRAAIRNNVRGRGSHIATIVPAMAVLNEPATGAVAVTIG